MKIVVATEAQKRDRDELTHAEWGQRLSVAQFVERERRLRATPFARASMTTWLLVDDRVLASLETFALPSRHGMRPGTSHGIASVYVEPSLRGRGYATALGEGLPIRGQAAVLFSDVGERMYARVGYEARPAFDLVIPARRGRRVARLPDDAVPSLLRSPRGRFAIATTVPLVAWHRERERIYADLFDREPLSSGVLVAPEGHALVAGDLKNEQLVVLELHATDPRRLFEACADEAARAQLREVVLWETEQHGRAVVELGGRRVARDGSLPMLRTLDRAPGLVASAWRHIPRALWM